jgi:LysR family cys regulon transcriptional activator
MKLQQLRYLCTIVDESFSITKAASKLHTSQPGISKQLRLLEEELNTRLLSRRRNRATGLTAGGDAILPTARRILKEAEALKQILADEGDPDKGQIVIATTHVHARYTLLPILRRFRSRYPRISIHLVQGSPAEIAYRVSTAEADIGLGTTTLDRSPGLISIPCFRMPHCVITPPGHPLLRQRRPALETIARYPFITTGHGTRLSNLVAERFASYGLHPDIVMRAPDIEVIKTYVGAGFGIAVIPTIAVDSRSEPGVKAIDASHIFEPTIASAILQDDTATRPYLKDLIGLLVPRRGSRRTIRLVTSASHLAVG